MPLMSSGTVPLPFDVLAPGVALALDVIAPVVALHALSAWSYVVRHALAPAPMLAPFRSAVPDSWGPRGLQRRELPVAPHGWFCAGVPFARMTSYAFVSFAAMSSIRIWPAVMFHWMYAARGPVGGNAAAGAELPSGVSAPTAAANHALASVFVLECSFVIGIIQAVDLCPDNLAAFASQPCLGTNRRGCHLPFLIHQVVPSPPMVFIDRSARAAREE